MIKSVSREQLRSVRRRLSLLYGGDAEKLLERLFMMIGRYGVGRYETICNGNRWNENDSVLITYADSLKDSSVGKPLRALDHFSQRHLVGAIRTIHLLPFCPWSSDDGFSVIDYRNVDPDCGDWADVERLGQSFDLMFDLVLNHCSAKSSWFKDFVAGIEPARHYFLDMDPEGDYSAVIRPRTSPLLTPTRTRDGESHVWSTFSADQIDLNWQNPEVLFEFIDILMLYISKGMRIVRLDAVAFLWKKLGTSCIHLEQTHEVVRLFRDIVEIIAPRTILLTETNVPHEENISYFGRGDEAHMIYQFSLPPLLLHGLATGSAHYLTRWARDLAPPPSGCTFFNFTASHDGVGVRPLEGILPIEETDRLVQHVEMAGGKINRRTLPDGTERPYELNITYYSALADSENPELGARRFLCSQALMLSLRGIPGVYLHSLIATPNDSDAVEKTGINRRINRHKWETEELQAHLSDELPKFIFETYLQMLRRRTAQPAFHPDAPQQIFEIDPEVFAHNRVSLNGDQTIVCVYNFTPESKSLSKESIRALGLTKGDYHDILSGRSNPIDPSKPFVIKPYQACWLTAR